MGAALAALESVYFSLQSKLADMLDTCQTDEQRTEIQNQYETARQNYWNSINKSFRDDDPGLQTLTANAKSAAQQVLKIDKDLNTISEVLKIVKQAVDISSQIASMASSL